MSDFEARRPWWRRTGSQIRSEVDEEIATHLELCVAELEAAGYTAAEARAEALRRFGDLRETREVCAAADLRRERRGRRRELAASLRQDAWFAVRQWRARPLAGLSAVLVLGLAIGATTAVFSVVDHVVLRPLPYENPHEVLTIWETNVLTGERLDGVSPADYLDVARNTTLLSAVGLAEPFSYDVAPGDGPPEAVPAWLVTLGYFEALGVRPLLGRLFVAADYAPDGTYTDAHLPPPQVVVVSEALWQRQWGGDPGVIGRTLELDGHASTVIGVVPASTAYPESLDLWTPKSLRAAELQERRSTFMSMVARVRPGVTHAQAQAELDALARAAADAYPASNRVTGLQAVPLRGIVIGPVQRGFGVLLGVAAFVLLIACASVAGLLLARGADRDRELAVRAALGAGHSRLTQQLLTEALVIGLLGGALGLGFAHVGLKTLLAIAPADLPRIGVATIDVRILIFLSAITLVATILAGLAPAVRLSRPDLMSVLRRGRGAGGGPRARLRAVLVAGEVALAFMLLIGAGLLLRSFVQLTRTDLGFDPRGRAEVQLFLWDRNPTAAGRVATLNDMLERIRALPDVDMAAAVTGLPFHPSQINSRGGLHIDGQPPAEPGQEDRVLTIAATPEYFDVMQIPVRAGRAFTARDDASAPRVAIVNDAFARRYFPGESAVGRRISIGYMGAPVTREVVGVVGDVRMQSYRDAAEPQVYMPHAETGSGSVTLVARSSGPAAALVARMREQISAVDPGQSIYHAAPVDRLVATTLAGERFQLLLVGAFSSIALLLAAIAIYGTIGTMARARLREFGVRLALGARPRDIVRIMIASGLRLALPGIAAGLVGALLLTRVLQGLLYATSPAEPATYAQIILLMVAVAVAAAWLPARQVLSRDPVRALREE
jgi:putative ABC transport system permease protein